MDANRLPVRAQELVKSFVSLHERVTFFLEASERDVGSLQWITHICTSSYEEIESIIEDTASVYSSLSFIRLLYRDNKFADIRDRNIRLVDALESRSPRLVLDEMFKYLDKFALEDRARSFLLLASKVDEKGNKLRVEWLDQIFQSFEVSPRALRPQLLLAASIIGHEAMVTRLLQDIAADEELMPNIDAVEAECLIEAAVNKHFSIEKNLLNGGRFSSGSETCWNAVVQALKVSCSNGSADIADILLPHYLSYCSVTSGCSAHHPQLLRLALSNWHFEIVEMLLDCDPRGRLCNMMELIVLLREEVAQKCTEVSPPGFVAIVVAEQNDDGADLLLWDAAALARGVSSGNSTLVRFLVNHVDFCTETLRAALATAQENENHEVIEVISSKLQKMSGQHARIGEVENETVDESMVLSPLPHLTRTRSEENTKTLRTTCLNTVEDVISSAQQSVVLKMRDRTDPHADNNAVLSEQSPCLIYSQPDLHPFCQNIVERVISSATQSVFKMNEMYQDELVQLPTGDKIEVDNETEMAADSFVDLQQPQDTYSDAAQTSLREFSSKVVDQIIDEAKSVATENDVQMSTIATEALLREFSNKVIDRVIGEAKSIAAQREVELSTIAAGALLREFSSKIVDQIIGEAKSAATQNDVEVSTKATQALLREFSNKVIDQIIGDAKSIAAQREVETSTVATEAVLREFSSKVIDQIIGDAKLVAVQNEVVKTTLATEAFVRESSNRIVDQIIGEGKAVAAQNAAEMRPTTAQIGNTKVDNHDSIMPEGDQPTVEIGTPSIELASDEYSPVCEQSVETDENDEEDGSQTDGDKFDVTGDCLVNSKGKSTASVEKVAEPTRSDDLISDLIDPVVGNTTTNAEPRNNYTSIELKLDETIPVQNVILQQEITNTVGKTVPTKEDNDEGAARSSHISDSEFGTCPVKRAVFHARNSVPTISSPAARPKRNTIICPVKWIEHPVDASKTSGPAADMSDPLSEGDHVEVTCKGRDISLPGVITFCHSNDVYDVVYDDGEEDVCVSREFIQLMNSDDLQKSNEDNPTQNQETTTSENPFSNENLENVERNNDDETNFTATASSSLAPQALWSDVAEKSNDMRLYTIEEPSTRQKLLVQVSGTTRSAPSLIFSNYDEHFAHNSSKVEVPNSIPDDDQKTADTSTSNQVSPNISSEKLELQQSEAELPLDDNGVAIEHLPEIPSVFVPNTDFEESATNDIITEFRFPTENSQRSMRERHPSVVSQQPRCRTADTVSPDEMAEWRNVDLLLNRKRRSFQTQTGSIESTKLPWGEEFATIQSLKRFAAQHPDILRAHIETQLRELDGPLLSSSPGKPRSPKKTNASTHSGAGQARESLLLIKDLAFLLKHRLAPFFDSIIPVVLEAVFSAEKRFLCETATEVLDAIILHCSSRKLALLLLQLNETYSKYEDLRLYNLASVYVEKCVHNWSKPECSSLLHSSQSSSTLLTLLATLLASKSAPGQIAAQKSFKHLRDELGNRNFEVVLRAHIPKHLQNIVKTECGGVPKPSRTRHSSRQKSEGEKQMDTRNPTTVQTGPSILQRMLLQRQNRVLPKQP